METRLEQAGLLNRDDPHTGLDIIQAWRILSRLGCPARFGGRTQDGSYEFIICSPRSGDLLASGRGSSIERSICEAALNASATLNHN